MKHTSFLLAPAACVAVAGLGSAQTITPVVVEGDAVPGVGNVTTIDAIAVNAAGSWMVESDTDNADTTADGVLLRDGLLYLRESDPLPAPPGAAIGGFDSVGQNASGDSGWNLTLDGTSGTGDDSGVFFNTTLIVQEGDVSGAPQFSPGTPYIGFFEVKINDAGQLLVVASIDDPAISSTVDRALVIFDTDGTGAATNESVLYKEGDVLPGQTEAVTDFGTGPHEIAFNAAGQVLFGADLTGDTTANAVIYLDGTELAQEGDPSPVSGRNWATLTSAEVDLNDLGQYVYSGSLDGDSATNTIIIKDGAKFVQEGDSLPAIAPFTFTSFGSGPLWIANDGSVLWYGDWDDADTGVDTGVFYNDVLLVQEGVTMVGGLLVDTVRGVQDGYALSPDGRWAMVEVEFVGAIQAALLIDLGSLDGGFCYGDGSGSPCPCGNEAAAETGCVNSSGVGGRLDQGGSNSAAADDLTFSATDLLPNQPALLFVGENAVAGGDGALFGDGLRCAGQNVVRLGVRTPDSNGVASWGPGLGVQGGWIGGDQRFFQVWYRDPVNGPCGSTFNLTNGWSVTFQP